ncbi:unnamed protein product, partial [Polarella glacialis]
DGLTLQQLLEIGILDHIETLERISAEAQKQHGLKTALAQMKREWRATEFGLTPHKSGTHMIKGIDEIQAQLDDHIVKTQGIRGSPFVKPIEKEVKDWEAKLIYIQDLTEQWLLVQRSWLYLEPIFGSDDIQRQMPNEAKRFQQVNGLWRTTMEAVFENPNVLEVSEIENLLASFTDANKKLDAIQKGLNDYLETKRLAFPRFFFLSNDELLMILSQTKDPTAVQPHMGKCFEGISKVRFSKNSEVIEAMMSVEGELVELAKPVNVAEGDKKGNVEKWLAEVQSSMIDSLTKVTAASLVAYARSDRTKWVLEWPGQVAICVDNIYWTQEVAQAIESGTVDDYHKTCVSQLTGLVQLVRGELSKLARLTLSALVTIDVHNRDVVLSLKEAKITSSKDFDWISQLRYYWRPTGSMTMKDTGRPNQEDKCEVSIINATLLYGFEYLGNSDRLVITPLTDRCYRTLMGAFHLYYGGGPEGPAGTGKTESTKDLAKAVAVQCVVFNCSDGLDYIAMGKFFKGIASSGAWCCFDEFNRINLEVLSVVSQQVQTIQYAVRDKKSEFFFEGTEIRLVPSCAVNITMNPGYAGRSELPDNLKALFRPCAMMVPDYAMIGEIVLYSFGFEDAKNLARKAPHSNNKKVNNNNKNNTNNNNNRSSNNHNINNKAQQLQNLLLESCSNLLCGWSYRHIYLWFAVVAAMMLLLVECKHILAFVMTTPTTAITTNTITTTAAATANLLLCIHTVWWNDRRRSFCQVRKHIFVQALNSYSKQQHQQQQPQQQQAAQQQQQQQQQTPTAQQQPPNHQQQQQAAGSLRLGSEQLSSQDWRRRLLLLLFWLLLLFLLLW